MKQILRVGGRWAVSWLCVGIILGIALMLGKSSPIGEAGAKPAEVSRSSFWVPVCAAAGSVFGFGMGVVYAALMIALRPLRAKAGIATWAARNLPRLTCGFVAGAIAGAWSGPEGAVMLGFLGLASAVVSRFDRSQT